MFIGVCSKETLLVGSRCEVLAGEAERAGLRSPGELALACSLPFRLNLSSIPAELSRVGLGGAKSVDVSEPKKCGLGGFPRVGLGGTLGWRLSFSGGFSSLGSESFPSPTESEEACETNIGKALGDASLSLWALRPKVVAPVALELNL